MLLLEAEVLELKANPDQLAQGVVIESRLTKGSGPVATVIIQKGTLHMGDVVLAGPFFGKVRALRTERGKNVREAGPAFPVEVHGLSGAPLAGENFRVIDDEKEARQIAEKRVFELRAREKKGMTKHLSLENLHERIQEGAFKELKLIIKADVQGSVEALTQSLEKVSTEEVRLHVIHGGVGGVNESDVMLAAASDAVILGFHVKAEPRAQQMSEEEGVDIRFYNIIYEAVEDVRKAMEGLLEPSYQEVTEGRAGVRKVFQSSKAGTVGGAVVTKGKLVRSSKVRLIRSQVVVFDGKLSSLKRFKDDVREVLEGYEFGFVLEGFSEIQEGDTLEAYRLEKGPSPKLK
jgi:translation initiation factor IF-2